MGTRERVSTTAVALALALGLVAGACDGEGGPAPTDTAADMTPDGSPGGDGGGVDTGEPADAVGEDIAEVVEPDDADAAGPEDVPQGTDGAEDTPDAEPDVPCVDPCPEAGATTCEGEASVATCEDPEGDGCPRWSEPEPCAEGEACVAGVCVCVDACEGDGEAVCDGDAVLTCADLDGDGCLELSEPVACGADETCSAGACASTCVDECAEVGAVECDGNAVRECGQLDGDPCFDLSAPEACGAKEACTDGTCVVICEDACEAEGVTACDEETGGLMVCGLHDEDPCLEFDAPTSCGFGELCADGECVPECLDDCPTLGAKACDETGAFVLTCGFYDDDPCKEWKATQGCIGGQVCAEGACVDGCADECEVAGVGVCVADGGGPAVAPCGDFDADSCLELGEPVACPDGGGCEAGVCSGPPTCGEGELLCDGACAPCPVGPSDGSTAECEGGACVWVPPCGGACPEGEVCLDGACVLEGTCASDGDCPLGEGCTVAGQCQPVPTTDSCYGQCNALGGTCFCDDFCPSFGDCCEDRCTWCEFSDCP